MTKGLELAPGYTLYPEHLDPAARQALLALIRAVLEDAPLYTPLMPRTGKPMSVRMSNCGPLGWVTDRQGGYRYQTHHPETAAPWPEMPRTLQDLWTALTGYPAMAEACLINYYGPSARMGLHKDADEEDKDAPILSVSLGDDALFRMGGPARGGKTCSHRLRSGDVLVMAGPARCAYHGIDRLYPGTSRLLAEGGRLNLTLRRVTIHVPGKP